MRDPESMRLPTPDMSIAILEVLLDGWERQPEPIQVRNLDGSILRCLMIRVFARHAAALTKSVIVLATHGMYIESAPLVRETLECAVTAAWMAITPHSAEAMGDESFRLETAFETDYNKFARWRDQPEISRLDTPVATELRERWFEFRDAAARNFIKRCDAFPDAPWLYVYYRWLSKSSHAGYGLLDAHLRHRTPGSDRAEDLVFTELNAFPQADLVLDLQVHLQHLAMLAWDAVADGHPQRADLEEVGADLGVNWNLYPGDA